MFPLVPAYPGCPGSKAVKRSLLYVILLHVLVSHLVKHAVFLSIWELSNKLVM